MDNNQISLYKAILSLQNEEEANAFFKDLCTPNELNSFIERWKVCQLLYSGKYSYREISSLTGASLTTISRVARFLKDENHHGYTKILERLSSTSK